MQRAPTTQPLSPAAPHVGIRAWHFTAAIGFLLALGGIGIGVWSELSAPRARRPAKVQLEERGPAPPSEPMTQSIPVRFEPPREQPAVKAVGPTEPKADAPASQESKKQKLDRLVRGVIVERRDATWARETEGKLRSGIENLKLPGLQISTVHCGSVRCALEATADSPSTLLQLTQSVPKIGSESGLTRARLRRGNPAEKPNAFTGVLVREGFDLEGNPVDLPP